MHSSLKVPPQHFSQVEVCTLPELLHHLYSFLLLLAIMLWSCCCVWDHCPVAWPDFRQVLTVRKMASHLTLQYYYRAVHGRLNEWKVSSSCDCKTCPNHQPSTALLSSWLELFVMLCCVWFSSNVVMYIMTKHLHFGLVCSSNNYFSKISFSSLVSC